MIAPLAMSLLRKALVFAAGALVYRGYITAEAADGTVKLILDNVDVISGAVLTLASIAWSVYERATKA